MIKVLAENFYIRSGLFSILSIMAAAINYSLYPALARVLTINEFGNFAAVIALSTQLTGILLAFNITSIYLVKNHPEKMARQKAQLIQKVMIWVFAFMAVIVLLLSPMLNDVLNIQRPAAFGALAVILLLSIPAAVWTGYLQGHKELIRIGSYSLISSVLRLLCVLFLAANFSAVAGLWGFALGMVMGLVVLRSLPGVSVPRVNTIFRGLTSEDKVFLKRFGPYIFQSIFVVGGLCLLQNFDITLSKMLFGPEIAGAYSGISILSNALYYILFLLIWIILPEIDIRNPINNKRVLKTSFRIVLFLTTAALIVETLLRNMLVTLLLGEEFKQQGNTLIFATLYQSTLVAVTLYAFYLLVLKKIDSIVLASSVLFCCISLPTVFAETPLQMIAILWLSVILGAVFYWLFKHYLLKEKTMAKHDPLVSIIIPVYNEAGNLNWHHDKLNDFFEKSNLQKEVIYIDDGSTDESFDIILSIAARDSSVRYVKFSRNFGKEAATTAGLRKARGDVAVMLDADGQHPVNVIENFVGLWRKGNDVVIGVRKTNQKEGLVKKYGSRLFNKILNSLTEGHTVSGSTDFRLLDRRVVQEFTKLSEHNRITRGLIDWLGFRRAYVEFHSPQRHSGQASYGIKKLVQLAVHAFVSNSTKPLQFTGFLGSLVMIMSAGASLFLVLEKYVFGDPLNLAVTGTAILALFLSFLVGLVLICQWLLALYVESIHAETQNRPLYIIDEESFKDNPLDSQL